MPDLNGTTADIGAAAIDPTIIIDPTFNRANEFSLVFGPVWQHASFGDDVARDVAAICFRARRYRPVRLASEAEMPGPAFGRAGVAGEGPSLQNIVNLEVSPRDG